MKFLILFLFISCSSYKPNPKVPPTRYDSGGLPLQFKDVLDGYAPTARKKCYKPYLKKFKRARARRAKKGKLEYKISLDAQGKVQKVVRTKKSKLPKSVTQCVYKGLKKLSFGKSEFSNFEILYPITFRLKK